MDSSWNFLSAAKPPLITFDHLNHPGIIHGCFSRMGGVSTFPFDSLNISFDVGDDPASVKTNCAQIKQLFGLKHLLQSKQVHGDHIYFVKDPNDPIPPCDALITNLPQVGLLIKHADCQAALIFDPKKKVIAAIHAGWKGLVACLYTKTINQLEKLFGCKREDLLVGISPSLGKAHAEFIHYKQEFPEKFWSYREENNRFNLWNIASDELMSAGVLSKHIQIAPYCTYQNTEYFSYRREKKTGRQGSVIALRETS